jgi:hypothetical protein
MKIIVGIGACIAALSSSACAAEREIPPSMAGDKGRYFLLDATKKGNIISTLHKRVGHY